MSRLRSFFSGFRAAPSVDAAAPSADAAATTGGNHPPVSRIAGTYKGTIANWVVKRLSRMAESQERNVSASRAEDLVSNDPHAASVIDSIDLNTVGTGILPQSNPHQDILGWSDTQVRDFQVSAEWCFSLWSREADITGRLPFWGIQFSTIHSLLVHGEYVRVPVMADDPGRTFSLALQSIHPARLCTPRDMMTREDIRDGILLSSSGRPLTYFIANTTARRPLPQYLSGAEYAHIPARIGHRPGIFHSFIPKVEEGTRGVSILAPAMKFFKDLTDYLDFELVGAIVAASFPVFIEQANPFDNPPPLNAADQKRYTEIAAGQVLYGKQGEKPHVLKSDRPSNSFPAFVERILRAVGASVGMPYEIIAKDFSKTNYSSARAALLEAWRLFSFYQKWLVDLFCQPVWEMVLEEAWLRGMIKIPRNRDWYEVRHAAARATWIPPKRGHVDPVKEITAIVKALENDLTTLAEANAETGGDWEDRIQQRARERKLQAELAPAPAPDPAAGEETDKGDK